MKTISVFILCIIVPIISVAQTISPDSAAHARFHIEQNLDQPITRKYSGNLIYPKSALRDSAEGGVWVDGIIDTAGNVIEARIHEGSREDLNDAALECFRSDKYQPETVGGAPVNFSVSACYHFRLRRMMPVKFTAPPDTLVHP